MITIGQALIGMIISLLLGGGIAAFLVWRRGKEREDAIVSVATSEANDDEREALLEKAKEQIKKNREAIKNAKKALENNNNN